jgi:predicted nuclease of predicted toxin-antitoxin system
MKFLIDMNLSPVWRPILQLEGWDSIHWSGIGRASAPDHEIMKWAVTNGRVVLTHDLDFGAMLAATQANGPSVAQVRTQDVRPQALAPRLVPLLRQYETELVAGALLVVDESRPESACYRWQRSESSRPIRSEKPSRCDFDAVSGRVISTGIALRIR